MKNLERKSILEVVMVEHQTQTPRRAPSQTPTDAKNGNGSTEKVE